LTIQALAHKTNHDIRRWQSKPWYTKQCFVCLSLDCQRLLSWFVLCARAWIVNALCRGLFCVPELGLSTPYVVVCFVCQGLDCQRLMSWFVLCTRAWIVNALCRGLFCVPGLGLSTPYVVVCFVCEGLDCQRRTQNNPRHKALTIQALAHKTNHDIRRWQSKPWHTKQTTT
jgi:hypothetical protein